MRKSWWVVLLACVILSGFASVLAGLSIRPLAQESLSRPRIYAYRDWQSLGIQLEPGQPVRIRAAGRWYYTPKEYHGPEGHRRYSAPTFYPLPGVRGGALIGRIGEDGAPFYVGRNWSGVADRAGILYLRIDDDILGDNDGYVTVDVEALPIEEGEEIKTP